MSFNIYIGYDPREVEAVRVCEYSIMSRTQSNPNIIALKQKKLRKNGLYWRPFDVMASTEFTITRFLVPYLNNYKGWALFCDCDFLWLDDVSNLMKHCDDRYAVMVVKHDYTPKTETKMDGKVQYKYPRKNWSSMVLWNCGHPKNKMLDLARVNIAEPSHLHRFQWLKDNEIGELPVVYNWLSGYYSEPRDGTPKAIHYTDGGPWFKNYENCDYADLWNKEKERLESDSDEIKKTVGGNSGMSGIEQFIYDGAQLYPNLPNAPKSVEVWNKRDPDNVSAKILRGMKTYSGIRFCKGHGLDFYYVDTGYFGNGKHKMYHRITRNNLQYLGPIITRPNDRLAKTGVVPRKMYGGSKILLVPPSNKVMFYFGLDLDTWVKQTVESIKSFTDREIVIRLKPSRAERLTTNTIEQALANDVHCLVTFNSIAAVEALIYGKPAITLGPNAAQPMCSDSLAVIENPKKPDLDEVHHFLCHLAYHQFTEKEMKDGTAWRILHDQAM